MKQKLKPRNKFMHLWSFNYNKRAKNIHKEMTVSSTSDVEKT